MNKQEFLDELSSRLQSLSQSEREKSLDFYGEMIVDRVEDGMSEEEAVAALGGMDDIVKSIMLDMPLQTLIKARVSDGRSRLGGGWVFTTLLIVGFPLWFSLALAFACAILAVYIAAWSVIISLYAVVFALGVSAAALGVGGVVSCFVSGPLVGMCMVGAGLVCAGLALLSAKPVILLSKQIIRFTAFVAKKVKSMFIVKGASK